jgi:pyrroloquinoline quinone biosynthesis protein D
VSEIDRNRVLRLSPGCRLGTDAGENILLMPESAVRLKGPSRAILELCDGTRSLTAIVEELLRLYPSADAARIEAETATLLGQLRDRGALEYG